MKPDGSITKPDPSDVTCLGRSALGPRKFLNRSSSGEPGGTLGMAEGGGALRVWVVAILTTVGRSLAARSAKESGAGRASADVPASARAAQNASANRMVSVPNPWPGIGLSIAPGPPSAKQALKRFLRPLPSAFLNRGHDDSFLTSEPVGFAVGASYRAPWRTP